MKKLVLVISFAMFATGVLAEETKEAKSPDPASEAAKPVEKTNPIAEAAKPEATPSNEMTRTVDNQVRHIQAYHGVNPHGLRQKARVLRNKATSLAWQSNKVAKTPPKEDGSATASPESPSEAAKVVFNKGYHRPNHNSATATPATKEDHSAATKPEPIAEAAKPVVAKP